MVVMRLAVMAMGVGRVLVCGWPGERRQPGSQAAEIIRCLKRYVAREVYPHLRTSS